MIELSNLLSQHRGSSQRFFSDSDFPRSPHQDNPSSQLKMGIPRECLKERKAEHPTQSLDILTSVLLLLFIALPLTGSPLDAKHWHIPFHTFWKARSRQKKDDLLVTCSRLPFTYYLINWIIKATGSALCLPKKIVRKWKSWQKLNHAFCASDRTKRPYKILLS